MTNVPMTFAPNVTLPSSLTNKIMIGIPLRLSIGTKSFASSPNKASSYQFGATTVSITTLSITTYGIKTLSIGDSQHKRHSA